MNYTITILAGAAVTVGTLWVLGADRIWPQLGIAGPERRQRLTGPFGVIASGQGHDDKPAGRDQRRGVHPWRAGMVAGIVLAAAVSAIAVRDAPRAMAATTTFTVANCGSHSGTNGTQCGAPLTTAIDNLQPGDTLTIAAGTYDLSGPITVLVHGTAALPITITGADHAHRPLLQGSVDFQGAQFATVSYIRFQAKLPGAGFAVGFRCGTHWTLTRSDVFDALATFASGNATGNMVISGSTTGSNPCPPSEPGAFDVNGNAFYAPYTNSTLPTPNNTFYHQIYAPFDGTSQNGGVIERNLFYGCQRLSSSNPCSLDGGDIKLGSEPSHIGPANVTIRSNTFYGGQTGVVMHWAVKNNSVVDNLFVHEHNVNATLSTGVALNTVDTTAPKPTTTITHSYGDDVASIYRDEHGAEHAGTSMASKVKLGPDNVVHDDNPNFNNTVNVNDPANNYAVAATLLDGAGTVPNGFVPQTPEAQPYGWAASIAPPAFTNQNTSAIITPAPGATVSGTHVSLDAKAVLAGYGSFSQVVFTADWKTLGTATKTSSGYVYVWDTTKAPSGVINGRWALIATAYDADGNNVASVPVTVTVHN